MQQATRPASLTGLHSSKAHVAKQSELSDVTGDDTMPLQGISLKAQHELQKQVYRKAAKILTLDTTSSNNAGAALSPAKPSSDSTAGSGEPSSEPRQDASRDVAMLSNMGCVQHAQSKHNTAAMCFSQALHKCAQLPTPTQVRHPQRMLSPH